MIFSTKKIILHTNIFAFVKSCSVNNYPWIYNGNTGTNMTIMLTTEFTESLPVLIETANISAVSNDVLEDSV